MATTSEARALPFFTDTQGQPLASGFIYIGQPGLDPVAYPATVTSDINGSVVVAQPVRTTNGHAAAAGALIHLFVPIPYSITILDSAGRLVYSSLNETDPVAIAVGSSSVQSAGDLASLRARDGSSTNQVWVTGFGMYVNFTTDNTSPESVPFIVVGTDGTRYHLDTQFLNASWVRASAAAVPTSQGSWLSWNDVGGIGQTFLTNNRGQGSGGIVLRTVNADNTVESGRVVLSPAGDVTANGNVTALGGIVAISPDGTKQLNFDGTQYNLPAANLNINGSAAVNTASFPAVLAPALVTTMNTRLVGCTLIGTTTPTPGTWVVMVSGVSSSGVNQYVRTA